MPASRSRLSGVVAALLLAACASSGRPPPAPAAAGSPPTASDGQARGMCMYDRISGRPRTCLQFSFGRCMGFGDPCELPSGDAAPAANQAPPPASR